MKKLLNILIVLILSNQFTKAQGSITWSAAMNVATSTYENLHPRITTNAMGNPVVIWGRASDASVFFSRWNGSAFTMPMKVNTSGMTVASAAWMGPDIASKGDTVYVVMKETPEMYDTNYIYLSRSVNGGVSFGTPVRVDNIADSISRFPVVTTDALGNPIVGFMKFDAAFGDARWAVTKSTNFGTSFSTDVKASGWSGSMAEVCDCCPGSITCSANKVAMMYRDNLSNIRDMWAGISSNTGSTFTQGLGYDGGNWMLMSCPSSGPDGIIIGDTLYTTYMSANTGDELVYFNRSSLSSLTNSSGTPLTGMFTGLTMQNYPRMAGASNALGMLWRQSVSGLDYLVSRFTNNVTSGLYTDDTIASSGVMNADIAMIDGKIFAVWQDYNSGTVKYRMGTFPSVTGIQENTSDASFTIYPNPANEIIYLQLSQVFESENVKLSIHNTLGEIVYTKEIQQNNNRISLSIKDFIPGIYLVTVRSGENVCVKKVVVSGK